MLLIVEKGIRRGTFDVIFQYVKVNNKYMKYYDKNKESLYLKYWVGNNLYRQDISQKVAINDFKWVEEASQLS